MIEWSLFGFEVLHNIAIHIYLLVGIAQLFADTFDLLVVSRGWRAFE